MQLTSVLPAVVQLSRGQMEIPIISFKLFAPRANCTKCHCAQSELLELPLISCKRFDACTRDKQWHQALRLFASMQPSSAGCHFQLNRGQIEIPLISCKLFARRANCTKCQCFLASGLRAGRADSSVPSLSSFHRSRPSCSPKSRLSPMISCKLCAQRASSLNYHDSFKLPARRASSLSCQ